MRNPHNRMIEGAPSHRCLRCRLIQIDCLCDLIPRVETRTRVVVVLHEQEDRKTSNTGRLAARCLPNSDIVIRGGFDSATPVPSWTDHGDPVLLFPHPDARPLHLWSDHPRPVTLIVPDGTWRQAQRVRRRIAGLGSIPCAVVSRDAPSNYKLRHTWDPRRLATLEAIAEALAVLEGAAGPAVREALLQIFQVMVERSLRVRAPVARPARSGPPPAGAIIERALAEAASGDVDLGIEDAGQNPRPIVR
ncbi:MAG: DTW domain-containing protein [Deltaproteobacteria bacterium]|nr:DTW domain-containing protein [Deltaproteobacteria bacterium]